VRSLAVHTILLSALAHLFILCMVDAHQQWLWQVAAAWEQCATKQKQGIWWFIVSNKLQHTGCCKGNCGRMKCSHRGGRACWQWVRVDVMSHWNIARVCCATSCAVFCQMLAPGHRGGNALGPWASQKPLWQQEITH